MRYLIILLALFFTKLLMASPLLSYSLDTISPPPEFPATIEGPTEACVGDTSVYTCDIPVSCEAIWYINNVQQSSATGELEVIWTESGISIINIDFDCDTINFPSDSLAVFVSSIPAEPTPIIGDTEVCLFSTTVYSTDVQEGESCQWIVDGVIQVSDTTIMSYYWSEQGDHTIEVRAVNECGLSSPAFLDVVAFVLPVVDLGNDTTIYEGQTLTLNAGNPGCTYLWSTGETTQSIIVTQSGNYEVVVSNPCGYISDDINVEVVVGIDDLIDEITLFVRLEDNRVYIEISKSNIESIQIWDITGRLVYESQSKPFYYLPHKGIFLIKAVTDDDIVVSCRFLN